MFCPNCGIEERTQDQYCRSCGTDLRALRVGLERPGVLRDSPASAREEIGRAVAEKARSLTGPKEMKVFAEEVLPKVEEFLEGPAERRLRRIRTGVVMAAIGLGAAVFFGIFASIEPEMLPMIGLGVTAFLIGLGIIVNGYWFTISSDAAARLERDDRLRDLLGEPEPRYLDAPASVVEGTTRELGQGVPERARPRATGE